MDLVRFEHQGSRYYGVLKGKIYPFEDIDGEEVLSETLVKKFSSSGLMDASFTLEEVNLLPFSKQPHLIIGIGLNYLEHASDLDEKRPDEFPVIFFKTPNTLIGPGESVIIPKLSQRTTGEAELGIVIGRDCHNVMEEDWKDYVAGFVSILDMTAEDILKKNTRYLVLSKVFDSFLSLGGHMRTEIQNLEDLRVRTVYDGEVVGENRIRNMMFSPAKLVSFLSGIVPLKAGDIISTGTPRASPLSHNGTIRCDIDGFISLENTVVDSKVV